MTTHSLVTALTSGAGNTAVGYKALFTEDDGGKNTAVGYEALMTCEGRTDAMNTAVGYQAAKLQQEAQNTVAIGHLALAALDDGGSNTAVGAHSMSTGLVNGTYNTAVGTSSLLAVTGGSNTAVGASAGDTITSGANNIMIGFHSEASAADVTYEIVIGTGVDISNAFAGGGTETCRIGRASDFITVDFGENATWGHTSDVRIKKDIEDSGLGLDFINDLRPVTFKKKAPSEYPKEFDGYDANETKRKNPDRKHYGFIAQEVKEAMDKAGHSEFPVWKEDRDTRQELYEAEFITPLIKAVQELTAKVEELEAKLSK
jgi:hypothetical protein